MSEPTSMVDQLRAAALGKEQAQKVEYVEIGDLKFEIRRLTIAQQKYIARVAVKKDGKPDDIEAAVLTVIYSTYVPGTDELVFNEKDKDELKSKSIDDWLERVFDAIAKVNKKPDAPADGEEPPVRKNSAKT